MIDTFYAKRLTAEMFKDTLSKQPNAVSVKGIQERKKQLLRALYKEQQEDPRHEWEREDDD